MARSRKPDLIVLDLEVEQSDARSLCSQFVGDSQQHEPPMVLLGTLRRRDWDPPGEIVQKPYHYGPLVRRIEEILETATVGGRRAA